MIFFFQIDLFQFFYLIILRSPMAISLKAISFFRSLSLFKSQQFYFSSFLFVWQFWYMMIPTNIISSITAVTKQAPTEAFWSSGLNFKNSACPIIMNPIATYFSNIMYIKQYSEKTYAFATVQQPYIIASFTHLARLLSLSPKQIFIYQFKRYPHFVILIFLMNFNDKNDSEPTFVLRTEEDQFFQHDILKSSDCENIIQFKTKTHTNFTNKAPLIRGKENDSLNSAQGQKKNVITNHSFNGYFNQNTQKPNKKINQSINKRADVCDITNKNNQVNSPTNFNSTGKLSNLQFVNDSNKTYDVQETIHPEVISFVMDYFPDNFQNGNFYGKYFSIQNFVEILFQQFFDLIGRQNGYNLIEQFGEKLFIVFGDKIYFEDLFEKTLENGLTGLIFEIVKSINQDRRQNKELNQNRSLQRPTQAILPKNSFVNKGLLNSGFGGLKSHKKSQLTNLSGENIGNSSISHGKTQKFYLERIFGNQISKVKFYDQLLSEGEASQVNEESIQEVKRILQDYIESMYEQAESKLNRKYAQEMKKITLKYKETQKLLEKINQRISNHYDSIQLEKEHEKKMKLHQEKQNELQNKIKKLEYELKFAKDEIEKEKLNSFRLQQESVKLKEKLQKYENAIFQKAMQKESTHSNTNGSSIMKQTKTNSSIFSQNQNVYQEPIQHENSPRFEVKIDTITEHRPIRIPVINTQSNYVPYVSRIGNNGGLTPTRIRELERTPSVSPLKQRISFVKTPNPAVNSKITITPNEPKTPQNANEYSRIQYSTNNNTTISSQVSKNETSKLKISSVVEIGQKVQLRPLSPIGKISDQNSITESSYLVNNQVKGNGQSNQSVYTQKTYSPIKVQFCTSRVTTVPTPK